MSRSKAFLDGLAKCKEFIEPKRSFLSRGCIFWPARKIPPPSKILSCFCGFFLRSFKLHKGILTCVLSFFSFFLLFSPFPFLFSSSPSNSSLFFNWDMGYGQNGPHYAPKETKCARKLVTRVAHLRQILKCIIVNFSIKPC